MSTPPRERQSNATLGESGQVYLRQNRDVAAELPPPDESWRLTDRSFEIGTLRSLSSNSIIEKEEKRAGGEDGNGESSYHTWKTTRAAWNYISSLSEVEQCPDGTYATGITNLGNGEYTCMNENCNCRMTKEQAKRILDA